MTTKILLVRKGRCGVSETIPCKHCGNYYSHKGGCPYWATTGMSDAVIILEIKQRAMDDHYQLEHLIRAQQKEIDELLERLKECEESLGFYADEGSYGIDTNHNTGNTFVEEFNGLEWQDIGKRAREYFKKYNGDKKDE